MRIEIIATRDYLKKVGIHIILDEGEPDGIAVLRKSSNVEVPEDILEMIRHRVTQMTPIAPVTADMETRYAVRNTRMFELNDLEREAARTLQMREEGR
jgi:hypothetical protein